MNVLLISGLPASGKGTQGKKIASCFRFVHIDAGERLRQEIDLKSETGLEAEKYIIQGKLVPDFLIKKVIKNTLEKYQDPKGFVFDGFPRTKKQAKILEELVQEYQLKVQGMIYLEVEEGEIINRIRKRAEESSRKDDQDPDTIQKRINEQKKQLIQVLEYYEKKNLLYKVNGQGSLEEVFERLKRTIEEHQLTND